MVRAAFKKWAESHSHFLAAGIAIGWMVGLSASPVLAPVLGALVGGLAGLIAGKLRPGSERPFHPAPMTWLLLGMAAAAPLGVLVRAHEILGPSRAEPVIEKGVEITQSGPQVTATSQPSLFSLSSTLCSRLDRSDPRRFRDSLLTSSLTWARTLGEEIDDDELLRETVEEICVGYSVD